MELRVFNKNLDVRRLLALKEGLLRQKILIDGFHWPYQALIPFLSPGCLRLERIELEEVELYGVPQDDIDLESIVLDVLADTVNVLSELSSMPKPAAGNRA
jgi:hypothetical protein